PPRPPFLPYTTLFRSDPPVLLAVADAVDRSGVGLGGQLRLAAVVAPRPVGSGEEGLGGVVVRQGSARREDRRMAGADDQRVGLRSEEHTSELQSRENL